jgi:AcrR family transcriptional regulator
MMSTTHTSKAPEGRRERRKRELRERIYEVASTLFLSHGFEATTVEQIAEAADIAPATFFNHFQNKQAVLIEMTTEVISHLQQLLDDEIGRHSSTRDRLLGFVTAGAADIEETRGIAREVLLTVVRSETMPGEPAPYLAQLHDALAHVLRDGQERGEVRIDQEAEFLAEMVAGIFNATVTGWLADSGYPIGKRLQQAAEFAWEAIQLTPQRVPK